MAKPMVRIHNILTNEIIDREMTNAEFDEYNKTNAISEAKEIEKNKRLDEITKKLNNLGLTFDDLTFLNANSAGNK